MSGPRSSPIEPDMGGYPMSGSDHQLERTSNQWLTTTIGIQRTEWAN